MLTDTRNRGRAYKCRRCSAVLRKGRMLWHVLKYHVPMDQVPFTCTLCRFGCQDRQTLLDHIRKYKRHVDAEAQLKVAPNYAEILKKAENPYVVGDNDMVMLSREESQQWWRSRCQSSTLEEDPFQDEEEEAGVVVRAGRTYPSWAFADNAAVEKVPAYEPTPISQINLGMQIGNQSTIRPLPTISNHFDTNLINSGTQQGQPEQIFQPHYAEQLATPMMPVTQPLTLTSSKASFQQATGIASALMTTPVRPLQTATTSLLNTPVLQVYSPSATTQTPCLDENILPALLDRDTEDPLYEETCGSGDHVEPSRKKARVDANNNNHNNNNNNSSSNNNNNSNNSSSSSSNNNNTATIDHFNYSNALSDISKAIASGFQKVVEALDANTRAIRCQDKTLDKAVSELSRIERKLSQIERSVQTPRPNQDKPATNQGTAHQKLAMKSVVKRA